MAESKPYIMKRNIRISRNLRNLDGRICGYSFIKAKHELFQIMDQKLDGISNLSVLLESRHKTKFIVFKK